MGLYDGFTLTELQAMRRKLARAKASGASRVRYADRDVQYRSEAEMNAAADEIDAAIASAQGAARRRATVPVSAKAF